MGPLDQARAFGLANEDFLMAQPVRRKILIEQHPELLKAKRILELGAHTGYMTEYLLSLTHEITVVESHPVCAKLLKKNFGSRISLLHGDIHRGIIGIPANAFDVIICTGVLYHSASPFFVLESIAMLQPELILIDTLLSDGADVVLKKNYGLDRPAGGSVPTGPATGFVLYLGAAVIDLAMTRLGYSVELDLQNIPGNDSSVSSPYLSDWKKGYRKWFRRQSVNPSLETSGFLRQD